MFTQYLDQTRNKKKGNNFDLGTLGLGLSEFNFNIPEEVKEGADTHKGVSSKAKHSKA